MKILNISREIVEKSVVALPTLLSQRQIAKVGTYNRNGLFFSPSHRPNQTFKSRNLISSKSLIAFVTIKIADQSSAQELIFSLPMDATPTWTRTATCHIHMTVQMPITRRFSATTISRFKITKFLHSVENEIRCNL